MNNKNDKIKCVKGELLSEWIKEILQNKGSRKQLDFLENVKGLQGEEFISFIEELLSNEDTSSIYQGTQDPPLLIEEHGQFPLTVTEGSMDEMPAKESINLYKQLNQLSKEESSSSSVWLYITLQGIKSGIIKKPSWLAVPVGSGEGGEHNIQRVIEEKDPDKIDRCVRLIIRRLAGPPEVRERGLSELYITCSFAKAWWVGHLADECKDAAELTQLDTAKSLSANWRTLGEHLTVRLTVVGERSVVAGLARWQNSYKKKKGKYPTTEEVKKACKILGEQSSWRAIGILSSEEIESLLESIWNEHN